MKKILFTSLAVLGLGITGCSNEDLGVAKSGVDEVCATMGDAESRTAMNGNSVVWSIGDEIGIFVTNGSSSTYETVIFTTTFFGNEYPYCQLVARFWLSACIHGPWKRLQSGPILEA